MSELSPGNGERPTRSIPHASLFELPGSPPVPTGASMEELCHNLASRTAEMLAQRPSGNPLQGPVDDGPESEQSPWRGLRTLLLGIVLGAILASAVYSFFVMRTTTDGVRSPDKTADPEENLRKPGSDGPSPSGPTIEWFAGHGTAESAAELLAKLEQVEGLTATDLLNELEKDDTLRPRIRELRRNRQKIPLTDLEALVKRLGLRLHTPEGKPRTVEEVVPSGELALLRDKAAIEDLKSLLRLTRAANPPRVP